MKDFVEDPALRKMMSSCGPQAALRLARDPGEAKRAAKRGRQQDPEDSEDSSESGEGRKRHTGILHIKVKDMEHNKS